ncbi:MAG: hypothetical protein GX248_01475 [Peptococcaceae bacterium]|nr:hypothetical protein [Peptococcaceae bacterium]
MTIRNESRNNDTNRNEMDDIICLDVLPKEPDRLIKELAEGKMVIARSKNDFMYVLDFNNEFHMFRHTPGSYEGSQKRFPKDEKHTAIVRNLANLADALFAAEYDKDMNIYGVMSSAEYGILSMFPGHDREADGEIEFYIPQSQEELEEEQEE